MSRMTMLGGVALVCLASACDADHAVKSGTAGLAAAICDRLMRCTSDGQYTTDRDACERTMAATIECSLAPGMPLELVDGCAADLRASTCDADPSGPACSHLTGWPRAAGLGESCEGSYCDGGLYCSYRSLFGGCSVCTTRIPTGGECRYSFTCAIGDFCDAGTCRAQLATGADCADFTACRSGHCPAGKCVDPLPPGATCGPDDVCDGLYRACIDGVCRDGLPLGADCTPASFCLFPGVCSEGTCREARTCNAGTAGDPCFSDSGCAAGLHCDDLTRTCQAPSSLNGSCETDGYCVEGTVCDYNVVTQVGTCVAPTPIGAKCTWHTRCVAGGHCDFTSLECLGDLADGQPCTRDAECAGGYCNARVCVAACVAP